MTTTKLPPATLPVELAPATRAYLLGFLTTFSPKAVSVLHHRFRRARKAAKAKLEASLSKDVSTASASGSESEKPVRTALIPPSDTYPPPPPRLAKQLLTLLRKSAEPHRFPAFCAVTIGGWTALHPLLFAVLSRLLSSGTLTRKQRSILASYLAAFTSSYAGIKLLNSKDTSTGGRTLDLTLATSIRAFDVLLSLFFRRKGRKRSLLLDRFFDEALFALSSAVVMYAWFYYPERLPASYNKWISDMGQVDPRLMSALRKMRTGEFVYGQDTGEAELLGSMCTDLGMPASAGDPSLTIPIPCKLVHEGREISCERNAVSRGKRGFKLALGMYLVINTLTKLRNPARKAFLKGAIDALRSSTFLGAFISLFWYGVCATRTRFGPKLFPGVRPIEWDRDYIVKVGCLICGWSIFFELQGRRAELAFFVAPKALAVLLPKRYEVGKRWKEEIGFAAAAGVLVTAARFEKRLIRGVMGRILGSVVGAGREM